MTEPKWFTIARSYLGVHEGDGLRSNPKVLQFFAEAGHPEIRNDHATPWCAAFVGAVLKEAGFTPTGTLWALDYARWGQKLAGPAIGAIGVKKRQGGGHVFFVAGFDKSTVFALGGNQNDRVCVERLARDSVVAWRWPPGVILPQLVTAARAPIAGGAAANARES